MKSLVPYLIPYRKDLTLGVLCLLLTNGFALAIPWLLKEAIDHLKGPPAMSALPRYALLLVATAFLQGFFRFLARRQLVGTAREVEYELRNRLFWHLLQLPSSFFQRTKTGDLMARATQDVNTVRTLLGAGIMYSANILIVYTSTIALMASIDPSLTLYALLPSPLLFLALTHLKRRIRARFQEVQEQFTSLSSKLQENLSGIRLVKAYAVEDQEVEAFDRLNQGYVEKNLALARLEGLSQPLAGAIGGFSVVIVLWAGGQRVIGGSLTLGQLVAFNAYLTMLIWPTLAMAWIVSLREQGLVSMERIEALLNEEPSIQNGKGTAAPERIERGIEFRALRFAYRQGDGSLDGLALKDINLKIPQGAFVAIVGPTGSGKSTLVNLIPRLLEVEEGWLFIDGLDVTRIPLKTLRENIGYVPQESFLFSDTIWENIAFGLPRRQTPDARRQTQVERAAEVADLVKDIETFPHGWETVVGERGITLSSGQRQRVGLARAVARDPQILILDDALSNVDAETEERILKGLRETMAGRTTLITTHRLSAIKDADLIVVLHEGRVVEGGKHKELLSKGGLYATLWRKQQLQRELEMS